MPLNDHKPTIKRRFQVNDSVVLKLPKFIKDENDTIVYPQEVLKAFIKHFNELYGAKVAFADRFIVDRERTENDPGKSHLDMFIYVPGDMTREDFLDDLNDFTLNYPDVTGDIIKRWPKETKQSKQGISMAKNAKSAYPERKSFSGLKAEELEVAKKAFKNEYGHEFDENNPEDKEDILELFNESQKELRSWYSADVRLFFNVGQFAPNTEGNVDLLSLYDSKKLKKDTKDEISIGEKIAKVFAKELEGECGPSGGENPKLVRNRIGLTSQMPTEWYTFNNDGSVTFDNLKDLVNKDPEFWGVESEDDKKLLLENNSRFNSVKDFLHSDLSWVDYLDEDKILKEVDQIIKPAVKDSKKLNAKGPKSNVTKDSDYESHEDEVRDILDDWGILYGDIVDNGNEINIVGVDESEWEDVRDALESDLPYDFDLIIPDEDHEEYDDEIVIKFK